jgi:hypothetical protein
MERSPIPWLLTVTVIAPFLYGAQSHGCPPPVEVCITMTVLIVLGAWAGIRLLIMRRFTTVGLIGAIVWGSLIVEGIVEALPHLADDIVWWRFHLHFWFTGTL